MNLEDFGTLGESLVSSASFTLGENVLLDVPILKWNPAAPLLPRVAECSIATREGKRVELLSPTFAAAAQAFCCASKRVQSLILKMHSPDLPISQSLLNFVEFATRCSQIFDVAATDILKAIMITKVNSHRGPAGWWLLFPLASKLAHSCSPNLAYVQQQGAFVAIKSITVGECLSFSYIGGPSLIRSSLSRQEKLKSSHLFVCQCSRCLAVDKCRQLRCGTSSCVGLLVRKSSPMLQKDADFYPAFAWKCDCCGHECRDSDLTDKLIKESKLADRAVALENNVYKFQELQQLIRDAERDVGTQHWTYASAAFHLQQYFSLLARNGCEEARHLVYAWGVHFLCYGLRLTPVEASDFPSLSISSSIVSIIECCKGVPKYRASVANLAPYVMEFVAAMYGTDDPRCAEMRIICSLSTTVTESLEQLVTRLHEKSIGRTAQELFFSWDRIRALIVIRNQLSRTGATPGLSAGTSVESLPSLESPQ